MAKKIDRIEKLKEDLKQAYINEDYQLAKKFQSELDQFYYGYQKK